MLAAIAAGLFAAALVIVYFDGYDVHRSAYDTGKLFGSAIRNVALGLIFGLLVNLFASRRRLSASTWSEVMKPAPFLGGGLLAVVLALAVGAPLTDDQSAEACMRDQEDPIEALPEEDRRALSAKERAQLGGESPGVDSSRIYVTKGPEGLAVVGTSPVGDSPDAQSQFRAGFMESVTEEGATLQGEGIAGTDASVYTGPKATAVYGRRGCYAVIVISPDEQAARGRAEALLTE